MSNTLVWFKLLGHYRQIILLQGNLLHMHQETHSQTQAKALHKSNGHTIEQYAYSCFLSPTKYKSHNCSEIPSLLKLQDFFITFWKAWVFELHHQLLTVKFNKETVHRNKLLLASGSQFLSTGTHISDGAFKGWKYDPIWLPNKHFLNKSIATEVKHRMSQSISVYVVTAHRNGYKTNCIIDPPLPTNIGLVDHD